MLGTMEGNGTLTTEDGRTIEGEFKRGHPHGRVKIDFPNEDTYEGLMEDGEITGRGTYVSK